jgi:uncharacterized protein (TIGR00255 family)
MTGYADASVACQTYEIQVQISSVNRRHQEILVRTPREYAALEPVIRQTMASRALRGQVTVCVTIDWLSQNADHDLDLKVVDESLKMLRIMAEHCHCAVPFEQALIELWKQHLGVEKALPDLRSAQPSILQALGKAIENFDAVRILEGNCIKDELLGRVQTVERCRHDVAQRSSGHVEAMKNRLQSLLEGHLPSLVHDDRVLREVIVYADRCDVSEELSRIEHHLNHMKASLESSEAVGKLLEFILQELLREWNTLGAKTVVSDVSTIVVLAKCELEKMREQVHNVE